MVDMGFNNNFNLVLLYQLTSLSLSAHGNGVRHHLRPHLNL